MCAVRQSVQSEVVVNGRTPNCALPVATHLRGGSLGSRSWFADAGEEAGPRGVRGDGATEEGPPRGHAPPRDLLLTPTPPHTSTVSRLGPRSRRLRLEYPVLLALVWGRLQTRSSQSLVHRSTDLSLARIHLPDPVPTAIPLFPLRPLPRGRVRRGAPGRPSTGQAETSGAHASFAGRGPWAVAPRRVGRGGAARGARRGGRVPERGRRL